MTFQNPDDGALRALLETVKTIDVTQAGARRYVNYTNLRGGDYTFRVKAANNDGIWNETGIAIPLVVTPPFWQMWWFQLGLAVGLIGMGAVGVSWRLASARAQNRRLEGLVSQRTAQLNQTNQQLEQEVEQRKQAQVAGEEARVAAEAASQAKSAVLDEIQAMLDAIDYGVLLMGPNLRARIGNRAFREMWGLPEEFIARPRLADTR